MNKKAQHLILEYLGYLILVALILATLLNVNQKIRDSTIFEQKAQVLELSYIHDIVQYSPSNIIYSDQTAKTTNIDDCKIKMQEDKAIYTYNCAKNHFNPIKESIINNIIILNNEKSTT